MIIGISGKMHSGKDLVGKIIQYLTSENGKKGLRSFESSKDKTDKNGYGYANFSNYNSPFSIHKFADKLKDIVCLLLDCSRENLEDDDFKSKELGPEWDRIVYTLEEQNGNVLGNYLFEEDAILDRAYYSEAYSNVELIETKERLTPRKLLTLLGTDCGRDIIHPNIWVNTTMASYKPTVYYMCDSCDAENILPSEFKEDDYNEEIEEYPCPRCGKLEEGNLTKVINDEGSNWIITDLRFPNELKAIKDKGGFVIRVIRPLGDRFPKEFEEYLQDTSSEFKYSFEEYLKLKCPKLYKSIMHESETSLDNCTGEDIKYAINGNGTKEALIEKVRLILRKERII